MARKRLLVVGAGAKAAAILARAYVLGNRRSADDVPEIIVVEKDRIAAAWDGEGDFSSGFLTLCTPAEKDVGYPYTEVHVRRGRPEVSTELFKRFSWNAFLVDQLAYALWVDQGRDHPTHRDFALYLRWVFERAGYTPVTAEVVRISPLPDHRWRIDVRKSSGMHEFVVDGVVLTGTGPARQLPTKGVLRSDRILTAKTFWAERNDILELDRGKVAVLGAGGASGAIMAWLADQFTESTNDIVSVSPMGTLFPRGDGYVERRWFSDPTDWPLLSKAHRREILDRTEGGVVSMRNKVSIDGSSRIDFHPGKVVDVSADDDNPDRLSLRIRYGNRYERVAVDYLVSAIGFDTWGKIDLVDLPRRLRDRAMLKKIEDSLAPDLSLPTSLGYPQGIHFPALGSMLYGPGIGNLSALSDMAERVLRPYCR